MLFGMINWTFTWLRPGGAHELHGLCGRSDRHARTWAGAMKALHVVVMGVAGCGKSAVGQRIARGLGLPLIEGDEFHPAPNIEKMRARPAAGRRRTGRAGCSVWARNSRRHPGGAVLTCSALKRALSRHLAGGGAAAALRAPGAFAGAGAGARRRRATAISIRPAWLPASSQALEDPAGRGRGRWSSTPPAAGARWPGLGPTAVERAAVRLNSTMRN